MTKFFPKTLEKINSPINGEIAVVEQFGKKRLLVNGLIQSGPFVEEIWKAAFKEIQKDKFFKNKKLLNVLILGLGGGSLLNLINKYFPQAKIVGIEVDPLIIKLAKKYFFPSKIKNLKIKIIDAKKYLEENKKERFDLVFVDLYIGDEIPKNCQTKNFLRNLKTILKEKGIIIFNRLYFKNHIFEAKIFLDKLKNLFNDVNCKKVLANLLIFAKKNNFDFEIKG